MPIPDYQTLMRPVLQTLSTGTALQTSEIRGQVAGAIALTEQDLSELVPSGQKPLFNDRISWALSYMKQAGVVERPKRGMYKITSRGLEVLSRNPERIDNAVLAQFEEFREFVNRSSSETIENDRSDSTTDDETPDESLESAYRRLRKAIEADLLQQVKAASPAFFEKLVVELLVAMGYGGTLKDAGQAVGKSGDEGIDGIIKEDRLGLDLIHLQAKRWEDKTVGRPDVQSFAGSLEGVRARKGVFITTSSFSADARAYVERIDKRIVLIDGKQLATLMYEHGVGVTATAVYAVKRVDSDYFGED